MIFTNGVSTPDSFTAHGNTCVIVGDFIMEKVSPIFNNPRVQIQQLCVVSLHTQTYKIIGYWLSSVKTHFTNT